MGMEGINTTFYMTAFFVLVHCRVNPKCRRLSLLYYSYREG